jgi:hypothetical protein
MLRAAMILLLACWASFGLSQDTSAVKFASPDGHFALRVAGLPLYGPGAAKVDLIETTSGKVVLDLGTLWIDREEPKLVWSSDSKWLAYATRTSTSGSGWPTVYFWDGSAFKELTLPANLPEPKIKPRKGDSGVKLKGYAEEPLKWIKPGELQLSSKLMGIGRDVGYNYTGSILITVAFDAHHRATVKKVTPTKTEVSE